MKKSAANYLRRSFLLCVMGGIGCCLWTLAQIYPWGAAKPAQVEAARARIYRHDQASAALVNAALDRTYLKVRYDGRYLPIKYPMGDVPAEIGVCTDEVIRSYRRLGIDLQQRVHEDMSQHFADYPQQWSLPAPDPNIDHRRVPNLAKFFERQGSSLPVTMTESDYYPGDVVTSLIEGRTHIAIVVPAPSESTRAWIMHNRGFGPVMEDKLFAWQLTGHFGWLPR